MSSHIVSKPSTTESLDLSVFLPLSFFETGSFLAAKVGLKLTM